jgi:hypothetical protein
MRHRRRPAAPFVPRVEVLEDRRLLAPCTIAALPGGLLQVRGTNGKDNIQVLDNGTAGVNNVVVVCRGQTMAPGEAITTVDVRTRRGNDQVSYVLNGPLLNGVSRTVTVDLGPGHDSFAARLRASLLTRSSLTINAIGGQAGDKLSLLAGSTNIAAAAQLNANLIGGTGPNLIQANYRGQLVGSLVLFASGRLGPDVISAQATLTNGSTGTGSVQERGGFATDQILLDVEKLSLLDPGALSTLIDGGPGRATCIVSPGVATIHCRHKTTL